MENETPFTLASFFPPLQQGAVDMSQLLDLIYLLTTPLFGLMFAMMVFFLKRLLKQNDESWKQAHLKFDKLVEKLELIAEKTITNEVKIQMHIDDKSAHNYGRRDNDV